MAKNSQLKGGKGMQVERRDFLKLGAVVGSGLVLGQPTAWAQETAKPAAPVKPTTNIADAMAVPKGKHALPGLRPGVVVEVNDAKAVDQERYIALVIAKMVERGICKLTGKDLKTSFKLLFERGDVVGIKVNPVGAGLISTRLELVDAVIAWLTGNGIARQNIVIWDRFDYMLKDAGFTQERFPGVTLAGLQTMVESDNPAHKGLSWKDASGAHVSLANFDQAAYYSADVAGPTDEDYVNQHVVNGKLSYFGNLLTKKLTKIINLPVFKNTGHGISMATKNLGYGSICNTGRLHRPLFFDVCTEVLAFPAIREKLVLNITDGLRCQYDGGPGPDAKFTYWGNSLFFATDPFALDMVCHNQLVEKRKAMGVKVNEHAMFTEYLRYAERLGLGIADTQKIKVLSA